MVKQNRITWLFLLPVLSGWALFSNNWITEAHPGYRVFYTEADRDTKAADCRMLDAGMAQVRAFFRDTFRREFNVYIHPDRASLDRQWQHDWNMPDFKSECWMVASGMATQLDLIAPARWRSESCEHDDRDTIHTRQLLLHELVHVFHGQYNPSPDFSAVTGLDWFVEGLATFASGQCDSVRMTEVRRAIRQNTVPTGLDDFWTGRLRYGLSGSLVLYLDRKYGREKLRNLLNLSSKADLLTALDTTEPALLAAWKTFMTGETGF